MEILVGVLIFMLVLGMVVTGHKLNTGTARKNDGQFQSNLVASSHLEKSKAELTNPTLLASLLSLMGTQSYTKTVKDTAQGKIYTVTLKYKKLAPASTMMKIQAVVTWDGNKTNLVGTLYPFET